MGALIQQTVPDPSWLSGFDTLGPVAILVGAIIGVALVVLWIIRQFRTGALVTDLRHGEALAHKDEEIAELREALVAERRINEALRAENGQQHRDVVRLTDEFKNMTLNVIGIVLGNATGTVPGKKGDV